MTKFLLALSLMFYMPMKHRNPSWFLLMQNDAFAKKVQADPASFDVEVITSLVIQNSDRIVQGPLAVEQELPQGGVWFNHLPFVFARFRKLKELRLQRVYIKELPIEISEIRNLETLELGFSKSADANKIIKALESLPSLKYLDLNSSQLSRRDRDKINRALSKKGVDVDDFIYLD
jgi:Leucine-rich repeat (LRR) protein